MAEKKPRRNELTDALFDAILSLETREECYNFFEDLCTVKELSDMAQRLAAAKMLLDGCTYEQIVKSAEISTATSAGSTAASSTGRADTAKPLKKAANRPKNKRSGRTSAADGAYIGVNPYPERKVLRYDSIEYKRHEFHEQRLRLLPGLCLQVDG